MTISTDEALYTQFSANAVKRFTALFTADKMNEAIYRLYKTIGGQPTLSNKQPV